MMETREEIIPREVKAIRDLHEALDLAVKASMLIDEARALLALLSSHGDPLHRHRLEDALGMDAAGRIEYFIDQSLSDGDEQDACGEDLGIRSWTGAMLVKAILKEAGNAGMLVSSNAGDWEGVPVRKKPRGV